MHHILLAHGTGDEALEPVGNAVDVDTELDDSFGLNYEDSQRMTPWSLRLSDECCFRDLGESCQTTGVVVVCPAPRQSS